MLFDMYNPKPVPLVWDFVANFVNNRGSISGSIPVPEFFTLTMISLLSFFCTTIVIVPTIFYSHFFKRCRDKGVFNKLIEHIVDVAYSNLGIRNMRELFDHVVHLDFKEGKTRRYFLDLWHEGLEELELNQKALVLYQMKLDAERRFQNKKEYFTKEYEEIRFQYRNNYENIVVEGNCEKCGDGPLALSYLDYRKGFAHSAHNDSIKLDCPLCGSKDSLVISNF